MRLTVACPEAHIADANQLAMAIGLSPADAQTYGEPRWQDGQGNRYAACSFVPTPGWLGKAQAPLAQPLWAGESAPVDLVAAGRAQARVVLWVPTEEQPAPPTADPETILAVAGDDGPAMLAAIGLDPVAADPLG